MEINYSGEHLIPGMVGNFFVVLAFVASFIATIAYYFASREDNDTNGWRGIARSSFYIHTLSVIAIGATLFYIIFNHYFEYHYAYQHSSKALPFKYVLSCFWEGQEGSFWLWMFWQSILGTILIRTAKNWEAPVMMVFSSVQIFLASMLLGIYIGDYKLGSTPFTLLREHPEMAKMPFVKIATYLENIDGRGLNPLLQNYWMTIHPPVLFLGFASTLVPFAYAIAALWKRKYNEWQLLVLPWTFFGVMILGTGILMGGAWAYESLSFGGFWAWDPVENASLVPWLIFVAGAHVLMINRHTNASHFSSLLFIILTFLLILYSTFLTRSGILGNTSVHAFTDLGMSGQLLVYLLFYLVVATILLAVRYKDMPGKNQEDNVWSREFWIFIGTLILVIAGFQITFTTSLPVINKIFGTNYAPPTEVIKYYNSWQTPFAVLVALIMAVGQYFKWKNSSINEVLKKLIPSLVISSIATIVGCYLLKMTNAFLISLFFASVFSVIANANYIRIVLKSNWAKTGSSIAHIGFGLILLGTLISQSKQKIISKNTTSTDVSQIDKEIKNNENVLLTKGDTVVLDDFFVTYSQKHKEGVNIIYDVDYLKRNSDLSFSKAFTLHPFVQTNDRMGNIAEPDTRHFLHKDIYTHVTYVAPEEEKHNDYKETLKQNLKAGDTLFAANSIILFEGLIKDLDKAALKLQPSDIALAARFKILDINNKVIYTEPLYVIRNNYLVPVEANVEDLGLKLTFKELHTNDGTIDVVLSEKYAGQKDFIVMKAIVFPGINILWIGAILMMIGTIMAVVQRIKKSKQA